MARSSKTGVRGLFKSGEVYNVDLRWKDPETGKACRYRKVFPPGTKLAAAKANALDVLNRATAGGWDPSATLPDERKLKASLDVYVKWRESNGKTGIKKSKIQVTQLLKSIGDVPLEEVTPLLAEKFKRERQADGAGPATVNRALGLLKHFFGKMASSQFGWVSKAVAVAIAEVPRLKEPPGRIRHLAADEEARLLATLNRPLLRIVLLGVYTGMRQAELITLKRSAVDMKQRLITLTKTKNGKVRRVPLSAGALVVLQEALDASPKECPHVFLSRTGGPYSERGVQNVFHAAAKRAGLEDFHFHDLRHTFATRLRRAGTGLDELAKLLGHAAGSGVAMTIRYAHVEDDMLRAAVERMPTIDIPPAKFAHPLPIRPKLALVK